MQLLPPPTTIKHEVEHVPRLFNRSALRFQSSLTEIEEDDDPFSHFLSPVLDGESSMDDTSITYTAGINPYFLPSENLRQTKLLTKARLEEQWESDVVCRMRKLQQKSTSSTPPPEDAIPDLIDEAIDTDLATSPDSGSPLSPGNMGWYFPSSPLSKTSLRSFSSSSSEEEEEEEDDEYLMMGEQDGWAGDRSRASKQNTKGKLIGHRRTKSVRKFKCPPLPFSASDPISPPSPLFLPIDIPKIDRTSSFGRKRHAWKEPSPGLWTVEEEEDINDILEDKVEIESPCQEKRQRKRCKFVHWNEEVVVVEYER